MSLCVEPDQWSASFLDALSKLAFIKQLPFWLLPLLTKYHHCLTEFNNVKSGLAYSECIKPYLFF